MYYIPRLRIAATTKYTRIPNAVKRFKDFCAELGEPSKLLLVAKLANPTFSCGIRKKIITIKNRLTEYPINFNIELTNFKSLKNSKIILQFQKFP